MYIDPVPNRNSPPALLLRESRREGKKTIKRTLANITHWPPEVVEAIRRTLKGETLCSAEDLFVVDASVAHGHVEAVLGTMRRLGLDTLIASKPCRERDLIVALVVERLLHPASKLATLRLWSTTTLAEELGVQDATVGEVYQALDWLLARQERIETKLARKHLAEDALVLYDVSSSSYEGHTCPLARFGHNRDGKKDLPCIVYGVLADAEGRPVAVDVYPGNTGDPTTVPDQVKVLRERFGLSHVVLVGDRGMLTQTQIDALRTYPGLGWISALRSEDIRALMDQGALQLSLFDEQRLAEIVSPDFPGERLMACYNPLLAQDRTRTREELLAATEKALEKIAKEAARRTRTPFTDEAIGVKVGKVINRHKVGKHFQWTIAKGRFTYQRKTAAIQRESELDGIYVIRTGEPAKRLSAEDTVRSYKRLAQVERAFRCLKGIDVRIRPIFHHTEDHVRAHIFLCMLAYYVDWHMRQALAPLLFHDEELRECRTTRDPVAPAAASASVTQKKHQRLTADGLPIHSFDTLLMALSTRCRNHCHSKAGPNTKDFTLTTEPSPLQRRAFELLGIKP
jgi:transposase